MQSSRTQRGGLVPAPACFTVPFIATLLGQPATASADAFSSPACSFLSLGLGAAALKQPERLDYQEAGALPVEAPCAIVLDSRMGKFLYDATVKADFEDRLLAHLQMVIGSKLRRGEPFFFVWKDDQSLGGGRTSVWVHSQASLVFKFSGGRPPSLNKVWLEALMHTANSPTGLYVVPEPADHADGAPYVA